MVRLRGTFRSPEGVQALLFLRGRSRPAVRGARPLTFAIPSLVLALGLFASMARASTPLSFDTDGDGLVTIADYFTLLRAGVSAESRDAGGLLALLLDPQEPGGKRADVNDPPTPRGSSPPNGGSDFEFVHFGLLSRKDATPGERGVVVPIWLGSREDVEGFRISVRFDPAVIENVRLRIESDIASRANAAGVYERRLGDGYIGAAVFGRGEAGRVGGPGSPGGHQTFRGGVLPCRHAQIAEIAFDIRPEAWDQPAVRIALEAMPDRLFANEMSVEGGLRLPREESPILIPIRLVSAPFIRGDVNGDGAIDIGDAVEILAYLFARGDVSCPDAADVDDDGRLLLGDPLRILHHVFGRGSPPPGPYPGPGLDPTPDALGSCRLGY